jgi:hypothetical protein
MSHLSSFVRFSSENVNFYKSKKETKERTNATQEATIWKNGKARTNSCFHGFCVMLTGFVQYVAT